MEKPMNWTEEFPTQAGCYWVKLAWMDEPLGEPVRIDRFYGGKCVIRRFCTAEEFDPNETDMKFAKWYGPLTPPESKK